MMRKKKDLNLNTKIDQLTVDQIKILMNKCSKDAGEEDLEKNSLKAHHQCRDPRVG